MGRKSILPIAKMTEVRYCAHDLQFIHRAWRNYVKKVIAITIATLCLQGCFSKNDQAIVKEGIMKNNQTLAVGEAFDAWSECSSRKWSDFKSSNGQRVVQFECNVVGATEFTQELKNILKNESQYNHFELTSVTSVFQWTINKDDSFQINGITTNWAWQDGKIVADSSGSSQLLASVYKNEKTFDLSYITSPEELRNALTARQYADMLWELHYKAN